MAQPYRQVSPAKRASQSIFSRTCVALSRRRKGVRRATEKGNSGPRPGRFDSPPGQDSCTSAKSTARSVAVEAQALCLQHEMLMVSRMTERCLCSIYVALVLVCGVGPTHRALAADASTAVVLQELHRSNRDGLELGRLAQRKGATQQARRIGDIIYYDHRTADRKVKALARTDKITLADVPATGRPLAEGSAFDVAFAQVVIADRQKDVADVSAAINSTTDKALQKLLDEQRTMLQRHIDIAKKLLATEHKAGS